MLGGYEASQSSEGNCGRGAQPPLEDRTNGVKVPCSTCRILCSYALLFSLSCLRYVELVEDELLVGAKELNTLTSKKALLWLLSIQGS